MAQAIAEEAINEELKDEALQAAEVAEAAAETAVNAGDAAPEVAEEATELAMGAAAVAEAAAEQSSAAAPADELDVGSDAATRAGGVASAAAVTVRALLEWTTGLYSAAQGILPRNASLLRSSARFLAGRHHVCL